MKYRFLVVMCRQRRRVFAFASQIDEKTGTSLPLCLSRDPQVYLCIFSLPLLLFFRTFRIHTRCLFNIRARIASHRGCCCCCHVQYIERFSELLDSESDGIEVSYNAAGILAHIGEYCAGIYALASNIGRYYKLSFIATQTT